MSKIRLAKTPTHAPHDLRKHEGRERLAGMLDELNELQNLLMAEAKHAVLVIIQGLDASGKDGLIRHVFGAMNPQGVRAHSFKVPTEEEAAHDFLWRIHCRVPPKGVLQVFNRSHYEDLLFPYVHRGASLKDLAPRIEAINAFERLLTEVGNTTVLKFFLHVSPEEQQARLAERVQNPAKMWKYNAGDFAEAKLRPTYYTIYDAIFEQCDVVPWTVVPADQNWYKELVVAEALRDALRGLHMAYPGLKSSTDA